jgi:hypothetical protein
MERCRGARLAGAMVAAVGALGVAAAPALAAPPANDDFANAQTLAGLPATASGTNVGATSEAEEPKHSEYGDDGSFKGSSVWYSWQAPSTTVVSVDTCDSDYNAALAVYTGSTLGGLVEVESAVAGGEPDCDFYDFRSEVTFKAFAGTTYRILVDGYNPHFESQEQEEAFPPVVSEGSIGLKIAATPPPANDDFEHAQALDDNRFANSQTVFGGLWGATEEAGEPDHAGVAGGASIWYSWTPSHGGAAYAVGCSGQIAVYTGDAVDDLTEVTSESGSGGSCPQVWFEAARGTTYRIALDNAFDATKGYVPMRGTYLTVRIAPENDDFDDAIALPSATRLDYSESTEEGSKEPGEPDHAGNAGGRSIWFAWTAPESATFDLGTCDGDGFDTLLAVYTGASLHSLVQVASNDNGAAPECRGVRSKLSFAATAGVTYRFAVDGHDGASGRVRLFLEKQRVPPPGAVEPLTRIRGRWINRARRRATFSFGARAGSAPVARFTCRIDGEDPTPCRRRITYRHLRVGHHTFVVWATDVDGLADSRGPRIEFWIPKHVGRRRHANG